MDSPIGWENTPIGKKYYTEPDIDCHPPDYLNNLDAMHEIEKILYKLEKWYGEETDYSAEDAYIGHLGRIVARDAGFNFHDDWGLVHATATQRAEAFLKTIDEWESE